MPAVPFAAVSDGPITSIHNPRGGLAWWVYVGGMGLAGVGGFVNVVMLLGTGRAVSHLTGSASTWASDLVTGEHSAELAILAVLIASFFVGAALSGLIVGESSLRPGRRYGLALVVEGLLLTLAAGLIGRVSLLPIWLAAMAMGLQNALATSYRQLVLRTTHVTGLVTDIGLMVGHALRHDRVPNWKMAPLLALLFGFVGGACVGALAFKLMALRALWIVAVGTSASGLGYFVWRARRAHSLWREV